MQGLLSSQLSTPTHLPSTQASEVVQSPPSLHGLPSPTQGKTQPESGWQMSMVQELPSSQVFGSEPTHCPVWQVDFWVQASPSSQGATLST